MANTSDIRKGLCIVFNNDIYKVIEFLHVKPGKGPAFVRTKLKSITTGKVVDNTFSAGHKIDEVRIETRKFQYLYQDDNGFHFMNNEDYSQIYISKELVDNSEFMKEGEEVTIQLKAEDQTPMSVELPQYVILEVTHTEPGVKGNTATNATKPATLETGAQVNVPLFINEGDKIRVNTDDRSYSERVKE
ncbi:MAG: elongation factor P [Flavobacteriaceae bacterium]|nr:MAG: elongation factor P [Flavobacteriaceae bacterium]